MVASVCNLNWDMNLDSHLYLKYLNLDADQIITYIFSKTNKFVIFYRIFFSFSPTPWGWKGMDS